jgi:cytochrome-b5 reductase
MGPEIAVIAVIVLFVVLVLVWLLVLSKPKPFLSGPNQTKSVKIIDIKELSHDTKRYRLDLGSPKTPLGLPIGKHIKIAAPNPNLGEATWNGGNDAEKSMKEIRRSYTPTPSPASDVGYFDMVIKTYRPGTVRMPDGSEREWTHGGKMSLYMDSKKVGDSIDILGPVGQHEYLGRGTFKSGQKAHEAKFFGMMAGGTGLTPMLQIANAVLGDKSDNTKMSLIYANKTEDDILCKDMLDDLVERSNGRFKVHYTLDFPPEGWSHKTGFITAEMIKECFPPPSDKPLIIMCGPKPMLDFACEKNLDELKYAKEMRIRY